MGSEGDGNFWIFGEDFEEGSFVEIMTAGNQEHFDFGIGLAWRGR